MNKNILYTATLAIVLGVIFAFFLWYGYLEKQKTSQSLDSVFASYSPASRGTDSVPNGAAPLAAENTNDEKDTAKTFTNTQTKTPVATKVSETPIGSGADIVGESVRYVDRAKGYIYETNLTTGKTKRISNIVLPGAFDVQFVTPESAIVQTLEEDGTIIAHVLGFEEGKDTTDTTLPLAILGMLIDTENEVIYALVKEGGGGSALVSFNLPYEKDKTPTILWKSHLSQWHISKGHGTDIYLEQKASNGTPGYTYTFNTKTKDLTKVAGDAPGQVTLASPSGTSILVSLFDEQRAVTEMRVQGKPTIPLARVTLPEKCLWVTPEGGGESLVCAFPKSIPAQNLPDIWYRGEFIFDDVLARVDPQTGTITEIETKLDTPVDMIGLKLTGGGTTLVFTDKTTGALWTVKNLK